MSARWLGRLGAGSIERLRARELLPGDTVCPARGRNRERVVDVARDDSSRTVDLRFESGGTATYGYDTDVGVERR
ncbi:MAG TPA: hypothetical protein VFC33_19305 [Acidimicrobiia bacterium]|jgi:hypothetical protein|nr:hypothetical protein [Acidimicrobiia bacterium]